MFRQLSKIFLGALALAAAPHAASATTLCDGLVFSVETPFTAEDLPQPDGDPTVSDGDLLSLPQVGGLAQVCARHDQLLAAFGPGPELGLDAVDVLDAANGLIAFSTELDHPEEVFFAGDLLFTGGGVLPGGGILPGEVLLFPFAVEPGLGLDAVHVVGSQSQLELLMIEVRSLSRQQWLADPHLLQKILDYLDADIWFSTETGTAAFDDGDLLSARFGTVVADGDDLIAGLDGERAVAYGLDAVTGSRLSAKLPLYFSTDTSSATSPTPAEGDLIEQGRGVDLAAGKLLDGYPEAALHSGLDAFHGPVDVELEPVTVDVDPAVVPSRPALPGLEEGSERPLSAMVDPAGRQSEFVSNELILTTADDLELQDFLARTGGEVLHVFDPAEVDLALEPMYLVKVEPGLGDLSRLAADLTALGGDRGRVAGEHRVSDYDGAGTLALASEAAIDGFVVGVNWTGEDDAIPGSAAEAASGATIGGTSYTSDPYAWPYMARGTNQDIGTAEAWDLLHAAGKLGNKMRVAVLDGGFEINADFPAGGTYASVVPFYSALGYEGFGSAWHATQIMGVVVGRVDNGFGVAGSAGPVAGGPIGILTFSDIFFLANAVAWAPIFGADVITISLSPRIPTILAWSVYPFEVVTESVGDDVLIFSSSGNEDEDVDEEDCAWPFDWPCWEVAWHAPCENDGVQCVSGLGWDSTSRHANSNYGHEHVDMYGPYVVWGGPDPDNPNGNMARQLNGTSYATPYVAGVAGLIQAADPWLDAGEVWDLMKQHAHGSSDSRVNRIVNAYDAVLDAIGAGGTVEITDPATDGTQLPLGQSVVFDAEGTFVVEGSPSSTANLTVRWRSNRDGLFNVDTITIPRGTDTSFSDAAGALLSLGTHLITVEVSYPGVTVRDTRTVEVVNTPPTAVINQPASGTQVCAGQTVQLVGYATDPNQVGFPASAFRWTTAAEGTVATGSNVLASFQQIGFHSLRLEVTDDQGATGTDAVSLWVFDPASPQCFDAPPTAAWVSPANHEILLVNGRDAGGVYAEVDLVGQVGDAEDGTNVTVEWLSSVDGFLGTSTVAADGSTTLVGARLHGACEHLGHTLTLRVTDSAGNVTTRTIAVVVVHIC